MRVTEIIQTLLRRDRILWWLLIGIIEFVIGAAFASHVAVVFGALVLFTVFDCYGFEYLTHDYRTYGLEYEIKKAAYRIIQNMFFVLLILLIWLVDEWHAAVMFVFMWWLGFCDFLFYDFLKKMDELDKQEDMFWLWWTPYGAILQKLGKPIHVKYLKIFSVVAFILLVIYGFTY
jgi:hypothetical protein